jgi:N-acetylglucosamine-6-phosphate deacetylase
MVEAVSRVWSGTGNGFSAPGEEPTPARVGAVRQTRVRGRVVTPEGIVDDGIVVVSGGVVVYAGESAAVGTAEQQTARTPSQDRTSVEAPAEGFVIPGPVDVHNHGGGGASFTQVDPEAFTLAAAHHLARGTTSVVASVVADRPEAMLAAVTAAADAAERGDVVAVHVEGPFLAQARCGAQHPGHLREPDPGLTRELLAAGRGRVRVMTVAPELVGAEDVVRVLLDEGVVPAVGHTEAEADLVRRTLAGVSRELGRPGTVTHLFNAMPPLHHRRPGPAAGALRAAAAGDARVELVADGVHLDDETVAMVFDLLSPERVVLVTDATAAAGMPDGRYDLGPQRVRVVGGVARLDEDGPLAGGTAHLLDVVRRCVGAGIDVAAAVTAATRTPAEAVGIDVGTLRPGARADLVVTDATLHPIRVMRGGRWVEPEDFRSRTRHAVPW